MSVHHRHFLIEGLVHKLLYVNSLTQNQILLLIRKTTFCLILITI